MTERLDTAPAKSSDRYSRFLLIVDCDANHLFYAAMLLQRLEYNICTAKTAEEALEMISVALPALVITEINLTGMSGLELTRRLKANGRTVTVPVIAVTEKFTQAVELECGQNGCVTCIRKPIQAEELYRTVQAAIENTPRSAMRVFTRLAVTVNNIELDYERGEFVSVLSEKGLYIRTLKPYPKKALIHIQMFINNNSVSSDALVLSSHAFGEGPFKEPGMGLQITRITSQAQGVIRQYIKDEITKGIKPF
jgi:two-component system, cell cycle response regulator DivK